MCVWTSTDGMETDFRSAACRISRLLLFFFVLATLTLLFPFCFSLYCSPNRIFHFLAKGFFVFIFDEDDDVMLDDVNKRGWHITFLFGLLGGLSYYYNSQRNGYALLGLGRGCGHSSRGNKKK